MKPTVLIQTHTVAAYRAIRPAIVASNIGYLGVSGMMISATINAKDYAYLVDLVNHAAQAAGVPSNEYDITLFQTVSLPESSESSISSVRKL